MYASGLRMAIFMLLEDSLVMVDFVLLSKGLVMADLVLPDVVDLGMSNGLC